MKTRDPILELGLKGDVGVNYSAVPTHATHREELKRAYLPHPGGYREGPPIPPISSHPIPSFPCQTAPCRSARWPHKSLHVSVGLPAWHTLSSVQSCPAGASPSWQKANRTLTRCPTKLGCEIKSSSVRLLSGQAPASPMLDQIRVQVGTFGTAQWSSASPKDSPLLPSPGRQKSAHYLQKMTCPRDAMARGSVPSHSGLGAGVRSCGCPPGAVTHGQPGCALLK